MTKNRFYLGAVLAMATTLLLPAFAADVQHLQITDKVRIPGATLKPGTYTLSVEDRLADRAIIKISSTSSDTHFFVLTVPNTNITETSADGLVYFDTEKEKAVRAWKCADCGSALEFVYPKAEAAKLTDKTTLSIMAVDPTYDKLPSNLSPDDMKVVTLWLLSPERITANDTGKGVKAAKYVPPAPNGNLNAANKPQSQPSTTPSSTSTMTEPSSPASNSQVATSQALAPAPSPVDNSSPSANSSVSTSATTSASSTGTSSNVDQIASNRLPHRNLPKTASNVYELLTFGLVSLLIGFLLRNRRIQRSVVDR